MEEVIKLLGGTAIAVGAVAWLIKSLVSHLLGKDVEIFKTQLAYQAEHGNHLLMQKISLYKEATNPIIALVVKAQHQGGLTPKDLQQFDQERLSTTALLGMFAPENVFNEYNNIIDYIYDSVEGKQELSFDTFRMKALGLLSEVRKDIGLYDDAVTYNGKR